MSTDKRHMSNESDLMKGCKQLFSTWLLVLAPSAVVCVAGTGQLAKIVKYCTTAGYCTVQRINDTRIIDIILLLLWLTLHM